MQDGSWAQEAVEGVTNGAIALTYPNFKFSFTIWMLGKADSYLRRLKAEQGTNGFADNIRPPPHAVSVPLILACQ